MLKQQVGWQVIIHIITQYLVEFSEAVLLQ